MAENCNEKYVGLGRLLHEIQTKHISLSKDEVRSNKKILRTILVTVTNEMEKVNPLFKKLYRRVFYGGSVYDNLRVAEATEFDLDLLFDIPEAANPSLTASNLPGFVHLQLLNYDGFMETPEAKQYKGFHKLFDCRHYLDTRKVLGWMEEVLQKTLNRLGSEIEVEGEGKFKIIFRKCGPALTLQVKDSAGKFRMDVDLVACFVFSEQKWPGDEFRPNPTPSKPEFFIVPKIPKIPSDNEQTAERYWRLSFQEQERELIRKKKTLKPIVRLFKKLRDNLKHKQIASYYIKTMAMWINEERGDELWNNELGYVFMEVLRHYQQMIENGQIPYFWNKNNNLIETIKRPTLEIYSCKLEKIITKIERDVENPTKIITKYFT